MKYFTLFVFFTFGCEVYASGATSTLNHFSPNNNQEFFSLAERAQVTEKKHFNLVLFTDVFFESLALYDSPLISPSDRMIFLHLGLSYGLTDHLEVGARLPVLLNQSMDEEQTGSSLNLTGGGITNTNLFLKYSILKSKKIGFAVLAEIGLPTSESNFYVGESPGVNASAIAAFDTHFKNWKAAFNFGYTSRSPGSQGVNYPFYEPIESTLLSVLAIGRKVSTRSKLSLEFVHSRNDYILDRSDRKKNGLEGLLSMRTQFKKIKLIYGFGYGLRKGVSIPAYRGFLGLNYHFGFKKPKDQGVPELIEQTVNINEAQSVGDEFEKLVVGSADKQSLRYRKVVLEYVEFDFETYKLNQKSKDILDGIAHRLKNQEIESIEIIGHTDYYGNTYQNEVLSLRRAQSVFTYFASQGVSTDIMSFKGYGKRRPLNTGTSEALRRKNRRVEIVLKKRENLNQEKESP